MSKHLTYLAITSGKVKVLHDMEVSDSLGVGSVHYISGETVYFHGTRKARDTSEKILKSLGYTVRTKDTQLDDNWPSDYLPPNFLA